MYRSSSLACFKISLPFLEAKIERVWFSEAKGSYYGAPYWTLLQTFLIYAQLQIYLLNFTLSILIAIFSCQIPSTYAMFYKKVSCVLIQYGQLYVPYGMMHRAPVSLK